MGESLLRGEQRILEESYEPVLGKSERAAWVGDMGPVLRDRQGEGRKFPRRGAANL